MAQLVGGIADDPVRVSGGGGAPVSSAEEFVLITCCL